MCLCVPIWKCHIIMFKTPGAMYARIRLSVCALGPSKNRNEGKGKSTGHTHTKVYSRGVGRRRLIGEAMRHAMWFPYSSSDWATLPIRIYTLGGMAGGGSLLLLFVGIDFKSAAPSVRSHTTGGLDMGGMRRWWHARPQIADGRMSGKNVYKMGGPLWLLIACCHIDDHHPTYQFNSWNDWLTDWPL